MLNKTPVLQQLFKGDAFATSLVTMMIDSFGTEFLEWTPYTIRLEIEENFHVSPTTKNFNLLMAGVCLLTQDSFYKSVPDFNQLCLVLSGELLHPALFEPADAASVAWGITEAMLLAPPDDLNNAFSPDIAGYVGEVLADEGILSPPDVLKIGHFNRSIMQTLDSTYSDDAELLSGIMQAQQNKTEDINEFIKKRLRALVDQLEILPLKNGQVKQVAEMMLKALPEPTQDEPLPSSII